MTYIIHKNSRSPGFVSYSGITWDQAGLRNSYRETYETKEGAEFLAKKLSEANPVGFSVAEMSSNSH